MQQVIPVIGMGSSQALLNSTGNHAKKKQLGTDETQNQVLTKQKKKENNHNPVGHVHS